MAAPLKISARVEIDPSAAKQGAAASVAAVDTIGSAAERNTTKLQALINASTGLGSGVANQNVREWTGALTMQGKSLDELRSKYNPLFATISRYKAVVTEIRALHAQGVLSTTEMAAAIQRERQATLMSIDAIKGRTAAVMADAAATNAHAARIDQLRTRFDPLHAAGERYRKVLMDISEAQRLGALTASQAIEVRNRETASYNAQVSALSRLASLQKTAAETIVGRNSIMPDRARDVAAYGDALDQLRAKYNPLYGVIAQYKAAQAEIRQAHAVGAISADEMTAALQRQRQATLASIDTIKGRNQLMDSAPGGLGVNSHIATNAMFQMQDIGMTAAMGMDPRMVGLQQGTQLAGAYAGLSAKEAATATRSALAGLFSTTSILAIGLTTVAAAAIQFGIDLGTAEDETKTLDDALKAHKENIDLLTASYGQFGEAVKLSADLGGSGFSQAAMRDNAAMMRAVSRSLGNEMMGNLTGTGDGMFDGLLGRRSSSLADFRQMPGSNAPFQSAIDGLISSARRGTPDLDAFRASVDRIYQALLPTSGDPTGLLATAENIKMLGENATAVPSKFSPFAGAINRLKIELAEGVPNLSAFTAEVERIGQTNGLQKIADEAILFGRDLLQLSRAMAEYEAQRRRLFEDVGPNKMLLSRGATNRDDMGNLALYRSRVAKQMEDAQRSFDAERLRLNARSPSERAAAARLSASLERRDEDQPQRNQRIELAGKTALIQAEKELADARRDRGRALDETLGQQQLELSLIGKTIGEQERLRMEYRLTAELKAEAARTGTGVDQAELARVKALSAEYGRLAEQMTARRALDDQAQEISALRVRLQLTGQAEEIRARAILHLETERRLREMGLSLGSREAEQYRRNAAAIADATVQLRKQEAAWDKVRDTAENTIDTTIDRALDGDFGGMLEDIAKDWSKTILTLGVGNPLKNAALGSNHETLNDIGGLGGMFSRLFGGGMSTSSMAVTAASVSINGGLPGVGSLLGAANDNARPGTTLGDVLGFKSTAGAGGALGFIGNYKSGVDARLTDILDTAAKQFPGFKVDAMSGFRPGDPRFHGKGLATDIQLTDLLSGKRLGNYQDASSFATYERFAQTARAVQMAKYPELADKFRWGGYFGGAKGKYGALDTMHFDLAGAGMAGGSWANGLTSAQKSLWPGIESRGNAAAAALAKVTEKSAFAAQGLGSLGTGMDKFGSALSNMNTGGSGQGGGIGGWLSSLFRPSAASLNAAIGFTGANTTLGTFLTRGWRGGGPTGGSDPDRVAGLVHEQEYVFDADATARIGVNNLEALRRGVMRGYRSGGYASVTQAYPTAISRDAGGVMAGGSNVSINIQNYSGAEIQQQETTDSRGNRQVTMVIGQQAAAAIKQRGNPARQAIQNDFNVRPRGISR